MKLEKIITLEEDLFPKLITNYIETSYGILFYNEDNKISYDSNHAVIYKDKIDHLDQVLNEISEFYLSKGIHPSIYQATEDQSYFTDNIETFTKMNFKVWTETPSKFMLLEADNQLDIEISLEIREATEWDQRIADDICIPSEEAYEIEVFKSAIYHKDSKVFVAYKDNMAVAILTLHQSSLGCVRFDYILVSKTHRQYGYGKQLISFVTDYCRNHGLVNSYMWPAHEVSEKISFQAGFRYIFTRETVRASYIK